MGFPSNPLEELAEVLGEPVQRTCHLHCVAGLGSRVGKGERRHFVVVGPHVQLGVGRVESTDGPQHFTGNYIDGHVGELRCPSGTTPRIFSRGTGRTDSGLSVQAGSGADGDIIPIIPAMPEGIESAMSSAMSWAASGMDSIISPAVSAISSGISWPGSVSSREAGCVVVAGTADVSGGGAVAGAVSEGDPVVVVAA